MRATPLRSASVVVNTSGSGRTIPANFVGISVEVLDLINGYYQGTTGSATSMISLLQLLGSNGVMRFGGSSSDVATTPPLTQAMATNAQAFLAAIGAGWTNTVIYGLDLFANNSALAATQAGYLANAFGASHLIFQFSNEPFAAGHFGSIAAYQSAWNAYYSAVNAAVPGAGYAAWDDSSLQDAPNILPGLTPGLAGMAAISYHRYSQGNTPAQIIDYLTKNNYLATNTAYLGEGNTGLQRLTETNSLGNRGVVGISDRLAGASFFLNEAILTARLGYAGVNIHNVYAAPQGTYNPIVQGGNLNFSPGPIFYGMVLFSRIAGQQILPSAVGGNANVMAIATKGGSGNANILVTNNDTLDSVTILPGQAAAWTTATVLSLQSGDRNGATSSVLTLGGQTIGESGAWSGSAYSINNGQSVTLGPCEAALIQIQP